MFISSTLCVSNSGNKYQWDDVDSGPSLVRPTGVSSMGNYNMTEHEYNRW